MPGVLDLCALCARVAASPPEGTLPNMPSGGAIPAMMSPLIAPTPLPPPLLALSGLRSRALAAPAGDDLSMRRGRDCIGDAVRTEFNVPSVDASESWPEG